jgi:hypothetical protein
MGSNAASRLWGSVRSLGRGRLIVYPMVGLLALATALVRLGWVGADSSTASARVVELRGQTAERQPVSLSLTGQGQVVGLDTRLIGVCGDWAPYAITWQPTSPAVRFRSLRGVVTATETKNRAWPGGISHITAWTTLRLKDNTATGYARYQATFDYRDGRRLRCDSGLVHWIASLGRAPAGGAGSILSFGRWSGYEWRGGVRSVAASWAVPRILDRSAPGIAGTWIGAQAPTRPDRGGIDREQASGAHAPMQALLRIPFIQVGVNEERGLPATGRTRDDYYAFWTDTAHHFEPIRLFDVHAGDQIETGLSLGHGTWRVRILDATSGARSDFATRDETGVTFNAAEWSQEHVTREQDDAETPYPETTPVVMSQLKVNSTSPEPELLWSRWMSENGRYLAPTPLAGDSFALRDTILSPAGARYLRIVSRLNSATERIYSQIVTGMDSGQPVGSDRTALMSAYQQTLARLRSAPWPSSVKKLIDTLADQIHTLIAQTRLLSAEGTVRRDWMYTWLAQTEAAASAGQAVRHALGLPSTGPD